MHFVNNEFELTSRLLALKFLPNSHTGLCLSNAIKCIITSWKIEKKAINATIDGGSNVNSAIDMISYLDKIRCITHVLNLVTKGILNENNSVKILDIVKNCLSLVCEFKHSNLLSEQLKTVM